MEHLSLEIFDRTGTGSKYATLPENTTISITDTSEVFASGDVWSHSFTLNVWANLHIFGTAGEIHGSRLHELLHKRKARLWVEGLPLYLGYLMLDDEVEVDGNGNVDVKFESGQKTFDELIEGAKANQVPMLGDVQIGVALWRKRWVNYGLQLSAYAKYADLSGDEARANRNLEMAVHRYGSDDEYISVSDDGEFASIQQYPRMVFPKGTFYNDVTDKDESINFLNTDSPYTEDEDGTPTHPYCNTALCYQKYGYEKKNQDGSTYDDYGNEPEAQRGYEYMPANRVNSAPNFYVAYWIRALMKHLGIYIEENQMMDVEDLRRLFFVNTNCAYEDDIDAMRNGEYDSRYGCYHSDNNNVPNRKVAEQIDPTKLVNIQESSFSCTEYHSADGGAKPSDIPEIESIIVKIKKVPDWDSGVKDIYKRQNDYFHRAYATSECFPNVDISEIISALENGFGIRFLFSDNYQRVRIVLLRNIFRNDEVQDIACEIVDEDVKRENCIRGFRMTYGNSEDTHFYYKGFADKLPHKKELWEDTSDKHDYSQWDLNADYAKIINQVSAFDKTCYVTPNTGDAYGIKVDKDAKRYEDLHPSLFEYAGFMDAEDGDCTGDEETIEEINVGFSPAIMNDLNMEEERNEGVRSQRFALFVDEQMRPRRLDLEDLPATESYNDSGIFYDVDKLYKLNKGKSGGVVKPGEFSIVSDMSTGVAGLAATLVYMKPQGGQQGPTYKEVKWPIVMTIEGHLNEGYRLYLQDNYEPNDDGISPIETHDWGLTLGIMRGSGSDAYVDYEGDPDDGEGNDTWDIMAGSNVTAHPDTCDNYGNLWDYNGSNGQTIRCNTSAEAIATMKKLWPNSNFDLTNRTSTDYLITIATVSGIMDDTGNKHTLLLAQTTLEGNLHGSSQIRTYARNRLAGKSVADMYTEDKSRWGILIEVDGSTERAQTLKNLQKLAFAGGSAVIIDGGDNGVGVTEGRFSLKLRAEKPNPNYGKSGEAQYLTITNKNLQGRGLADQFYKEYSYWVRNARIVKRTVRMTLAQLLSIDKTVRVTVGDVTGFIKKMEYTVSNQTGLGNVTMEIMYI